MESSNRPVSAGAQSSYSDFMAQWKRKLDADDTLPSANIRGSSDVNGPSDLVSDYSAQRSIYAARSQTPPVAMNNATAVSGSNAKQAILEVLEESESDNSDGGTIPRVEHLKVEAAFKKITDVDAHHFSNTMIVPKVPDDSDGSDGAIILSKVERRRLNSTQKIA